MRSLAAEYLLPGPGNDIEFTKVHRHRVGRGSRIANRKASAVVTEPVQVRQPYAAGSAVVDKYDIVVGLRLGEIRQFAIIGPMNRETG